jgi:hypothetical protein
MTSSIHRASRKCSEIVTQGRFGCLLGVIDILLIGVIMIG